MSIEHDARHLFQTTANLITPLRQTAATLNELEHEALEGNTPRTTQRTPSDPQNDAEPATGHVDPTGDIATAGALTAIRRQRTRITDAIHDTLRTLEHLEHLTRTATTTPPEPVPETQRCPGDCGGRIKEPGRTHCLTCSHAQDVAARAEGEPMCGHCHVETVESYPTKTGIRYRGMCHDGTTWQPIGNGTPACHNCRRQTERNRA